MTLHIETERLILRRMEPQDADSHIAMMRDPDTAAYLSPTKKPQGRMELWRNFASYLGHWEIRGFGFMSVIEKESGDWVGRVWSMDAGGLART